MRKVGVFFTAPGEYDYPFTSQEYIDCYHQLDDLLAARGAELWIVRDPATYLGGNRFRGSWRYKDGVLTRHEGEIDLDIIFNRGRLMADDKATVINEPELEEICTDKFKSYELIPEHCPRTALVKNREEAEAAVKQMRTDSVVAKPLDLEEGHGVFMCPKKDIVAKIPSFPYLIQELLDLSGGIPGIVEGVHDFRIILVRGEVIVAYVRQAKKGSLLANVAQGGKMWEVPREEIPQAALEIVRRVDQKFKRFAQRVYSVDLGLDADGQWKIIELNSKPGLSLMEQDPGAKRYLEVLAELLTE